MMKTPFPTHSEAAIGAWRDGTLLVMHNGARLTQCCVKTNLPATRAYRYCYRRFSWWEMILMTIGGVCGVPVKVKGKEIVIEYGLSSEWISKQRIHYAVAWGLGIIAMTLWVVALSFGAPLDQPRAMLFLFGLLVLMISFYVGVVATRVIYPQKTTDHFIWFHGACPKYLAELPEWPMYEWI